MSLPDPLLALRNFRCVATFEELALTPFASGVNAFCLRRTLAGDFAEVARRLEPLLRPGINSIDEDQLLHLSVSAAGCAAVEVIRTDLRRLRELDLQPELSCIRGAERAFEPGPVRTDVGSWHVDSATVEADTWLCTYHGAWSELLPNDDAIRRIDVPETRAELLRAYVAETGAGADDDAFREWLGDHCYDLHYVPRPGAQPVAFGHFNLWRIATEWPDSPVPPCIHRAPETLPGDVTRLLLLS